VRFRRNKYAHLNPAKLRVIDFCARELGARSFADLGGIWAVDGGYARYAADVHKADRVVVVDEDFTPAYLEAERDLANLEHVEGNFGDAGLAGSVDVALFFDVLLHQVAPDWDELLGSYAPNVKAFGIVQPQWNGPKAIRLLELGEADYLAAIPAREPGHGSIYDGLFDRLDETNEQRGRPWRDVHDIWQWGITDAALVERMQELGFELRHSENTGPWRGLERFHEGAFVFERALVP